MAFGDKGWFEEGEWPLAVKKEITHHHFEDLRKRIFMLRYPWAGHATYNYAEPYTGEGGSDTFEHGTTLGQGTRWERGSKIAVWKGELWTNTVAYEGPNTVVPDPPYEYVRPVRVKHSGTIYKCVKIHKSSVFADDLAAEKWQTDSSIPHIDTTNDDYYTPPDWTTDTGYMLVEWVASGNGWAHAIDTNMYHDCDAHKSCYVYGIDSQAGEGVGVGDEYDYSGASIMPAQTEEIEHHPPVHYRDTDKIRWIYRDKIGFKASHITMPRFAGAQWTETYMQRYSSTTVPAFERASAYASDRYASGTQYSNGLNIPSSSMNGVTNKKCNESYQCQIEMLSDLLRYPVDGTYIASYTAWRNRNAPDPAWAWDDTDAQIENYPPVADLHWGCNASGFEFFKKLIGDFDWYWDDEYPYIQWQHQLGADRCGDDPPVFYPVGATFPMPVGTWRRWWKHSMGRPCKKDGTPKFMRAIEMGVPTMGNYTGTKDFSINDGDSHSYTVWYPAGTFVTTLPVITNFINWSDTIDSVKDGNIFIVAGNYTTVFKAGSVIYIGTGSALTGYTDCNIVRSCYNEDDDETEVTVSIDVTDKAGQTVCGDSRITARHDPVQFENRTWVEGADAHWKYTQRFELRPEIINEMHDVLYHWDYVFGYASTESRMASGCVNLVTPNPEEPWKPPYTWGSLSAVWSLLLACKGYLKNPDDWIPSNSGQFGDANSPVFEYGDGWGGCDFFTGASYRYTNNNNPDDDGYNDLQYTAPLASSRVYASALRLSPDQGNSLASNIIKNSKAIAIKLRWRDSWDLTYSFMILIPGVRVSQSCGGGVSTLVVPQEEIKYRYRWIGIPTTGEWITFLPQVIPYPIPCQELIIRESTPPYTLIEHFLNFICSAPIDEFSFLNEGFVFQRDINKVPATVFARDLWGLVERDISPTLDDTRPPLPNPAGWNTFPYAEFEYREAAQAAYAFTVDPATDVVSQTEQDLAENTPVGFIIGTNGVLPAGLVAGVIYKIVQVTSTTCKIARRLNGVDTLIDITSAGTAPIFMRKMRCVELHIKASLIIGEDLQGSNPVHYHIIGRTPLSPTVAFQHESFIDIIDRYLTMAEVYAGGIALSGAIVNPGHWDNEEPPVYHPTNVTLHCTSDPRAYLSLYDNIKITNCLLLRGIYVISEITDSSITIATNFVEYTYTFDPEINYVFKAGDPEGYYIPQWEDEDCYSYELQPQMRDDASFYGMPHDNLGSPGKVVGIAAPTVWPIEIVPE
jgi:hypothetical protein